MLKSTASVATAPAKATWRGRITTLIAACCLGSGGWLGYALQDGANAVEEVAKLLEERERHRQEMQALTKTAQELRQHAVDRTIDVDQAIQRLDAIAAKLETALERDRQFSTDQRKALDALLGRRPDLRTLHLGADVLQHWNRSNQGPDAAATAPGAGTASQPTRPLPNVSTGDQ